MEVIAQHRDKLIASRPWEQQTIYDLSCTEDQVSVGELLKEADVMIIDPFEATANALYDYRYPDRKKIVAERQEFVAELAKQGQEFGKWVFFPWEGREGALVRYPDQDDHFKLRTSRNRNLNTLEEQTRLYKGVAITAAGLSVGQPAVKALVEAGIGDTYCTADFDSWGPDNQNRTDVTQLDMGSLKIDEVSKHISKKDPWIRQIRLPEGINEESIKKMDAVAPPKLIIEEVDNMGAKKLLREYARNKQIPLLMAADIDTTSAIDVERYDLRDKKKIMFGGKLTDKEVEELSLDPNFADNTSKMLKHIGVLNLSTAMLRSSMERDVTLGGLPQLGMTARRGGANLAFAAREILLGRPMSSGRYKDDPRKIFKLGPATSYHEYLKTIVEVARYMKRLKNK